MRILCIIGVLLSAALTAQDIPLGSWRTHLSYAEVNVVTAGEEKIYAAVNSGVFYFDTQDNSVNRLTELDGLQGGGITALAYDQDRNILLIGYATGNMDLVEEDRIINLDLISNSQVIGSKQINHILPAGAYAYIATDFGVLKLAVARAEVQETYREIGPDGAQLAVHDLAIYDDSLFIATNQGIRAGRLAEVNLADWRFWADKPLPGLAEPAAIATAGSRLFAVANGAGIFTYSGNWENAVMTAEEAYRTLSGQQDVLIIVTDDGVQARDPETLEMLEQPVDGLISNPYDALRRGTDWWIGDGTNGLLSDFTGSFVSYSPSGPASPFSFAMRTLDDSLYVLTGGYSSLVQPLNRNAGVHVFSEGQWTNRLADSGFGDLTDVAGMPGTGDRYYASAGDGLLRVGESGLEVIDENSPGSPLTNPAAPGRGLIIPAISSGDAGLWVLNYGVASSLHYLDGSGNWTSYTVPVNQARFAVEVEPVGDLIWLRVAPSRGGGLVVFDPASGEARFLGQQPDNGSLPSIRVNDMELDKDGFLWLGTDAGISIITNPFSMQGPINAVEPVFDGRPLLIDEEVQVIRTDGGNRKWVGTGNGAWLFDASADELLLRFTAANSPLPASDIESIGIMGTSGEVFFGTGQGIVSYRSDASESGPEHGDVRIFPNPVRRDFMGTVGITGLVENAEVKITDSAGRLVYRTRASGGTASWIPDSENLQSGVYFVFSATPDGEESVVGKIAVIR